MSEAGLSPLIRLDEKSPSLPASTAKPDREKEKNPPP
jgi:hypothetical protein